MLVAIDDLSNIVGIPAGGCSLYYKSQVDPDSVREPLVRILELLNA